MYEMFIGDFEKAAPWSNASIRGSRRFLERVWGLQEQLLPQEDIRPALLSAVHRTIRKVDEDIENLKFNTAIAAMMALINDLYAADGVTRGELRVLLTLLNPFAPHMTEEIWERQHMGGTVAEQSWPQFDPACCKEETVEIAVQVCGKIRAKLMVDPEISAADAVAAAKENERVAAELAGKTVVKEIYIKGKLVNIVAK